MNATQDNEKYGVNISVTDLQIQFKISGAAYTEFAHGVEYTKIVENYRDATICVGLQAVVGIFTWRDSWNEPSGHLGALGFFIGASPHLFLGSPLPSPLLQRTSNVLDTTLHSY
jgi:hypothetical protein